MQSKKKQVLLVGLFQKECIVCDESLKVLQASDLNSEFDFKKITIHRYLWNPRGKNNDYCLEHYMNHKSMNHVNQKIDEIEEKYNIPSIRRLYKSDPLMQGVKQPKAITAVWKYFDAWENFFKKNPFDYVFSFIGPEVPRRSLYYVCKKRGIKILSCQFSFFKETQFWMEHEQWKDEKFKIYKYSEISEREIESIHKEIKELTSSKHNITHFRTFKIRIEDFKILLRRLKARFYYDRWNYRFRIHFYVIRGLTRVIRAHIGRFLYQRPRFDKEKFVFFPLHQLGDFQLCVRAPHLDQVEVIRNIAESLPNKYVLYTKEHPNFVGGYPLSFLLKIRRIENVRLINPGIHPHQLIPKAQFVITINSSAGFESLAFDVPVVTLTKSEYSHHGLTYDVENLIDLPEIFRKVIREGIPYTEEEKIAFFFSLKKYSVIGPPKPFEFVMSRENILAVPQSIREKILRYESSGH